MSMPEIIESIPEILKYFVSGYIFVVIFSTITSLKIESSIKMIFSCIISFIWIAVINVFLTNTNIWFTVLISCGASIIFATVFGLIYISDFFCNILINLFGYSPMGIVWDDIIDINDGTNLMVYLQNEDYHIIGHYDSRDRTMDGEFWICLCAYIKCDNKTNVALIDHRNDTSKRIVFHSNDIQTVEVI